MTLDDYISKFYKKELNKYVNKRTKTIVSLEEIEIRYNWLIKNSFNCA
jgi:hypothetical protein